jgi:hypothetical protein
MKISGSKDKYNFPISQLVLSCLDAVPLVPAICLPSTTFPGSLSPGPPSPWTAFTWITFSLFSHGSLSSQPPSQLEHLHLNHLLNWTTFISEPPRPPYYLTTISLDHFHLDHFHIDLLPSLTSTTFLTAPASLGLPSPSLA